jgi:hypothetical protein
MYLDNMDMEPDYMDMEPDYMDMEQGNNIQQDNNIQRGNIQYYLYWFLSGFGFEVAGP